MRRSGIGSMHYPQARWKNLSQEQARARRNFLFYYVRRSWPCDRLADRHSSYTPSKPRHSGGARSLQLFNFFSRQDNLVAHGTVGIHRAACNELSCSSELHL